MVWKNYFDVVILPPSELRDYAIKLSKQFPRQKTFWRLGKKSFIPHISLYHIPVKPKNFNAFISCAEKTIMNYRLGRLTGLRIKNNLLIFDNPAWIKKLYLNLIRNVSVYYDRNYGTDKLWREAALTPKMRTAGAKFLKKYGTPMAGANFLPHITLTNFKTPLSEPIQKKLAKRFSFKPESLYICELGPFHTCQRIVRKIDF